MVNIHGMNFEWITKIEEFKSRAESLKSEALHKYDTIGSEKIINFQKIAQNLADFELKFSTQSHVLTLYQSVHPDKSFRDESTEVDKMLSDLKIDLSMRKDVFDQFVKLKESSNIQLSTQKMKYIDNKIKDGKLCGLHCDELIRKDVEIISKELSRLKIDFDKNLSEENKILEFTVEELDGCSEAFINALEKSETDSNKRKVSLKYPHYFPIMKHAVLPGTRQKMEFAFNTRCKDENGPLLKEMIKLRGKKAKLLGFETHSDYVLSNRMAKEAKIVWEFLQELREKLIPMKDEEISRFLTYKKQLCEKLQIDFIERIDAWDLRFFMNIYEEEMFSVNHEVLREYFPLGVVRTGMFEIYEKLLGLQFDRIDGEFWYSDVELFSVKDSNDKSLLGYFFLDLHPREGKYGHAQVTLLQPGGLNMCEMGEPTRQVIVVAMLANFTKPTDDKPALLNHDEVITFFHEFGHVMHSICCDTDFGYLASFNVERDFVECPSQMLENWCWQEESLRMMSSHHKTGQPLENELLNNLLLSRMANTAVHNTRQICLASFDQIIHTQIDVDPVEVYRDVTESYMGIPVTEGTNMPATFNHMAGGYDAQYYGYLWSEVFAADMFISRFKKEGLLNPKAGHDYREFILKPGSSKDASELIKDFLGRAPNQDAFLTLMGLKEKIV